MVYLVETMLKNNNAAICMELFNKNNNKGQGVDKVI